MVLQVLVGRDVRHRITLLVILASLQEVLDDVADDLVARVLLVKFKRANVCLSLHVHQAVHVVYVVQVNVD